MLRPLLVLCALVVVGCCDGTTTVKDPSLLVGVKPPPVGPCDTPAGLKSALEVADQSAVLDLYTISPLDCSEVGMTQTWAGGKLIFSDSPEHPAAAGKVYEDMTLGATAGTDYNRIFLYHTNGLSTGRMKWTVLIKNNGGNAATLTVQKAGTAGPTTSYLYAGKKAFERWLLSTAGAAVQVPVGGVARLDPTFDSVTAAASYLMHGIWDYSITEPHTVTVCALGENDDPVAVCPTLQVLPRDTHQRGTCPNADKVYDVTTAADTAGNVQQFPLAGGTANDSNAQCVDKTDNSPQVLTGNYGVLYRMHVDVTSTDGRKFGFLLNPRGGSWGGAVWTAPGLTAGGKFLIPAGTASISSNAQGALEGRYDPAAAPAPWFQWMATGGATLPLRFVLVPY